MPTAYIYDGVPLCVPQFTGKERDTETGLDYFGARYYGSSESRFTSPTDCLRINIQFASRMGRMFGMGAQDFVLG